MRDAFIAVASINSSQKVLNWKDVFVILQAMFICDFCIISLIVIKNIVLGIVAAIKRDLQIWNRYFFTFEIFMLLVLSFSILLYVITDNLGSTFQELSNTNTVLVPSSNGQVGQTVQTTVLNLQALNILSQNMLKAMDILILQILIFGMFIVHFSPPYQISCNPSHILHLKDKRKTELERHGFLLTTKKPYVFRTVRKRRVTCRAPC